MGRRRHLYIQKSYAGLVLCYDKPIGYDTQQSIFTKYQFVQFGLRYNYKRFTMRYLIKKKDPK